MEDVIKNEEPCPECKSYNSHWIECSLITVEGKAAKAMHYYEAWRKKCDEQHGIQIKWQQWAVMWQGKHAILRHENNKLRREMYRQKAKKQPDGLGGVSLDTSFLASGFCKGLSMTDRYNFTEDERKMLKAAGDALLAAARNERTNQCSSSAGP